MTMTIKIGQLRHPDVIALLAEHHADMLKHSPQESVHALDLSKLEADDISFWTLWMNNELAGCCALKALSHEHGEIKSMRTSAKFLRQGVAKQLLIHLIEQAKQRAYKHLSLETGTADAFKPAHHLYQQFGFQPCQPFAHYQADPYSMFMTKNLC